MKNILKILITILIFSSTLLAKSGLEIGIFVPIGMSVGINTHPERPTNMNQNTYDSYISNNTRNTFVGFETGALVQIGYKLDINRTSGFSFLAELGYSRDTFNYKLKDTETNSQAIRMENYRNYTFDSFLIGVLPKFNYKRFSIGIGAGVKIALAGTINNSSYNPLLGYSTEKLQIINTKNYKDYFKSNIIPYIKLAVDYSIYTSKKFDFVLGGYAAYDFPLTYTPKNADLTKIVPDKISSFDIGFNIGVKIRPL